MRSRINFNKKYAFTLAEVLVTLGIIGVVSAITVPALTQNWQRKAYATQLHKVYSEIEQAFEQAKTDKNALNIFEIGYFPQVCGQNADIKNFFHTYFKVVKDCGQSPSGCFADEYKNIKNGTLDTILHLQTGYGYSVTIADGAAISMTNNGPYYTIYIDTNSTKGPNIAGRDLFRCNVRRSGIDISIDPSSDYKETCIRSHSGIGCIEQLINDGWEMKY